ncbi:hypothetical protein ACFQ6E_20335 [Streptomyces sp. NPDC056462]|uniref:hypothetical protein n=1 Tax=Streptomyces sp. NPDC056462 TaxID=3345826 RepID=UPI0036A41D60
MAVDWWARGIAIGAALAAAVNVGYAAATYRRNRPRIAVEADHAALGTGINLTVKLINTGSVSLPLDQVGLVSLEVSTFPARKTWYGKPVTKRPMPRTDIPLELEERHVKLLPAFSAVEWYFDIRIDHEMYDWLRELDERGAQAYMRVRVPLPHLAFTDALTSNVMESPAMWLLTRPLAEADAEEEPEPAFEPELWEEEPEDGPTG